MQLVCSSQVAQVSDCVVQKQSLCSSVVMRMICLHVTGIWMYSFLSSLLQTPSVQYEWRM